MITTADKKSFSECVAYLTKDPVQIAPDGFTELIAALGDPEDRIILSITNEYSVSVTSKAPDWLQESLTSGREIVCLLRNGNCVVPLAVREEEENGRVLVLFDPLASPKIFEINWERFFSYFSGRYMELTRISNQEPIATAVDKDPFSPRSLLKPVAFAGFLINILGLTTPFFLMLVLDKVVSHNASTTLIAISLGAILLIAFESAFSQIRSRLINQLAADVTAHSTFAFLSHLITVSIQMFESRPIGHWLADARDPERLSAMLHRQLVFMLIDYMFAFLIVIVLVVLSWQLTLIAVTTAVLQLTVGYLLNYQKGAFARRIRETEGEKESTICETIALMKTVQVLALGARQEMLLRKRFSSLFALKRIQEDSATLANSVTQFIERVGNIVMLSIGAVLIMESAMTVGTLIACNILMRRLTNPLTRLPEAMEMVKEFREARGRHQSISKHLQTVKTDRELKTKVLVSGRITLKGVYFQPAKGSRFHLLADMDVPAGKTVAIVGRSGSGKTTLANLMLGLNTPQAGVVTIDGIDLRDVDQVQYREQIGVASNDISLFRASIRSNIACWNDDITLESIQNAASLAGIHEEIQRLPMGYETQIGEEGKGLSTGQKARINLARALVKSPPLLIIDEITNELDRETENAIVKNISHTRHKRTTIYFTHSEVVACVADFVIFVENGRVAYSGTHMSLLSQNEKYAAFWGGEGRRG